MIDLFSFPKYFHREIIGSPVLFSCGCFSNWKLWWTIRSYIEVFLSSNSWNQFLKIFCKKKLAQMSNLRLLNNHLQLQILRYVLLKSYLGMWFCWWIYIFLFSTVGLKLTLISKPALTTPILDWIYFLLTLKTYEAWFIMDLMASVHFWFLFIIFFLHVKIRMHVYFE